MKEEREFIEQRFRDLDSFDHIPSNLTVGRIDGSPSTSGLRFKIKVKV
jgi:hypothetical protein